MKAYTLIAAAAMAAMTALGGCASVTAEQRAKIDAADRLLAADQMVQAKIVESSSSIANTLQLIERIERGPAAPRSASGLGANMPIGTNMAAPSAGPGQAMQGAVQTNAGGASGGSTAVASSGAKMASGSSSDLLESRLKIDWRNGSAEELLRTLANQMGIPFKIVGVKKQTPPVTVVSENETMGGILISVGKQVDRSADIVLNKSKKPFVLELRYK